MAFIFHIATKDQWQQAQVSGQYQVDSLASEGFIHCSTSDQLLKVANRFYAGKTGLALLCIDTDKLDSECRFEDASGTHFEPGEQFPHIYGPINVDSVIKVVSFEPGPDGKFNVPGRTMGLGKM